MTGSHAMSWRAVVGLVGAALMVGAAYLTSGWIERAGLLFRSLAGVGAAAAFGYGVWRSRSVRPIRRLGAGIVWVGLWAGALVLPYGARWGSLRWEASRVPMPADASDLHIEVDPIAFNWEPDFLVSVCTSQPYHETREFYWAEFARRGWSYHEPDSYPVSSVACCRSRVLYEPKEPIGEDEASGLTIFRRGNQVLAVQVSYTAPVSVEIYPFERRRPALW